jgi:type VI secretion system protein ImpD
VITAASPGAGGGAAALLPPRIVDLKPGPADDAGCGVRECVVSEASGALRARAAQRLDAWLATQEPAPALRDWFGPGVVAGKRWLLPALDRDIADVDALISAQVNAILHSVLFQRLEARWRGLDYLTDVAELSDLAKVRMLSLSWNEVARDLDRAADFDHSQLFHKIYTEEIGTLGGEPLGLLIGDYEIQHRPSADHPTDDIAALKSLAMIASAAFAPLVMGASPALLQLESFSALGRPVDLPGVFRQAEYHRWQSMREAEETRFIGLVAPRVLMRLPYTYDAARRDGFRFQETVDGADARDYLWGNAAFAFGSVVLRAFASYGWFADIRGAARDELRGGLVMNLPVASFATDAPGVAFKPSIEALLSDTQEKDLADLGFIALRKIPFTEYPVFYSNQSIHAPPRYDRAAANVNARLSAMLQYMLCISRFAHYIKLLGRRFIGTMKTAEEVQQALIYWLMTYVTSSDEASQDSKSRFPLRDARVEIKEVPGKAGAFSCVLFLRPHFQLDDIATGFRLVTQLAPAANAA